MRAVEKSVERTRALEIYFILIYLKLFFFLVQFFQMIIMFFNQRNI